MLLMATQERHEGGHGHGHGRHQRQASRTVSSEFTKGHSRQASRTESIYTIRQTRVSWLQRCLFWRRPKPPELPRMRTVVPNHCVPAEVCAFRPLRLPENLLSSLDFFWSMATL